MGNYSRVLPEREGQIDWLLDVNGDSVFLVVDIRAFGQVDFGMANVAVGAEVHTALDDGELDALADVLQIAADLLELARGHLYSAAKKQVKNKYLQ